LFARLRADEALSLEVDAGWLLRRARTAEGVVLPVLVHALQPERQPAAARFHEADLQLRDALEEPIGAEGKAGEHLLQRMAGYVAAELAVAIIAGLRQDRAGALVHADGHAQIGGGLVDRQIVRVVELAALYGVGPPEDPQQAQLV